MMKGRMYIQQLEANEIPESENYEVYVIYIKEVERAIATFLEENIQGLRGDLSPKWIRNMTILERRDYLNWGRQQTVNNDGKPLADPDETFL